MFPSRNFSIFAFMMFFYNLLVNLAYFILKIIASFNPKIKLFITGRKDTFNKLASIKTNDKVIWIHAASLGEFEQGRPIIERLKKEYPTYKIAVTFFSPSGYEIRKDYNLADVVCYLPFDSKSKMQRFIQLIHPELAIIVKYEFWPNLLQELKRTNTKSILVSGIFREDQAFFKWYGKWMQQFLSSFNHFFVQNQTSKQLLNNIGLDNVTVCGDTRFDRVSKILEQNNTLDFISEFKNNSYTVVAGSTWKEDEELLINYINTESSSEEKFIIAPHNINSKAIRELKNSITKKIVLFSEKEGKNLVDYNVFLIDTIGILTKIYAYADIAYIGGGLATGLHNILEPATFGIPLVFGDKKYKNFQEATDLHLLKGAALIGNQKEFTNIFLELRNNKTLKNKMGNINKDYVQENIGATELVMTYINNKI